MDNQLESYLEELFRPQDQRNFIKDVRNRYKKLDRYRWEIHTLLSRPSNYIFDEIVDFIDKMEDPTKFDKQQRTLNYFGMTDHWWNNIKFRKEMYRKYKIHIAAIIKQKMKGINRNLPKIKKVIDVYFKEQAEFQTFIDSHKEIYNKISTRWYNIFGGPKQYIKSRGDWTSDEVSNYKKFLKMPPAKIASDYLCIRFIMGVDDTAHSEVSKILFGGGFEHRHSLMSY